MSFTTLVCEQTKEQCHHLLKNATFNVLIFKTVAKGQFQLLSHYSNNLIGLWSQVMPISGFLVSKILNLPSHYAAGLILVGCCPGGMPIW